MGAVGDGVTLRPNSANVMSMVTKEVKFKKKSSLRVP
jgi:hypothetical protein